MKYRYFLIAAIVFLFCSKEQGTISSYTKMEPITLRVEVKDPDNQPVTEGFVKMNASVGLARSFGGWQLVGREETKALSHIGTTEFYFEAEEIIPTIGYITIWNLEVLDRTLHTIYADTTDFTINSGVTRTVNFTIE